MKNKPKENTNMRADRIIRIDVNDFTGKLLERWKASITNKPLGIIMVLKVKELFNLTMNDLNLIINKELEEEKRFQLQL